MFRTILTDDRIFENEDMKCHTSFRIGGKADLLLMPADGNEACGIINVCQREKIDYTVIGNGSNLLVSDKGIRGVVVKLGRNFSEIKIDGCKIIASAGALLSSVASKAAASSLTGLEFSSGIPGSLGGAVFMNAGAYGGEMSDVVAETEYIDNDCQIKTLENHGFSYRKSIFQSNGGIILKTVMRLEYGNKEEIYKKMDSLNASRREKQPLNYPSAGSAFKRPDGYFAAKLIDDAGLRGYRIGGAAVSEKHTGFIVNLGGASAKDVLLLMDYVKNTVLEKSGVLLESEIRFVGEE